jgi:hypothetical protein
MSENSKEPVVISMVQVPFTPKSTDFWSKILTKPDENRFGDLWSKVSNMTISELIKKYITDTDFKKSISSYTLLHTFYRTYRKNIKNDMYSINLDNKAYFVSAYILEKYHTDNDIEKIKYNSAIYHFIHFDNVCELFKYYFNDKTNTFKSNMDTSLYCNTSILYKLCAFNSEQHHMHNILLAYLKMIPKDYYGEINKIIRANSNINHLCVDLTSYPKSFIDYDSDKFLHIEHLYSDLPKTGVKILLDNNIEPFDRHTGLFIKTSISWSNMFNIYGIFHGIQSSNQYYGSLYHYTYRDLDIYNYMIEYYTEKNDQEALLILNKILNYKCSLAQFTY